MLCSCPKKLYVKNVTTNPFCNDTVLQYITVIVIAQGLVILGPNAVLSA